MGPPIYIGGNNWNHEYIDLIQLASMGPPIYIGGNRNGALLLY